MSKQLSSRDYEMLSAYLDGELSQKDTQRIELRLKENPEMRAGLDELQYTQRLLSKVPMRRAPRNFMIKPSMLPQKRRLSPAYPFLRLASALASILLVVAFASDLFLNMGLSKAVSRMNAPAAQPVATQAQDMQAAQPALSLPESSPNAPALDLTQAAGQNLANTQDPFAAKQGLIVDTPTPEPTPTEAAPMAAMGIMPTPTGTIVGLGGGPMPDETQTAIVAQTNAPPGLGAGPLPATSTPEAGGFHYFDTETPAAETGLATGERAILESPTPETETAEAPLVMQAPVEPTAAQENAPQPTQEEGTTPAALRLAEIILAITALGTGTAAILLRMRSNA